MRKSPSFPLTKDDPRLHTRDPGEVARRDEALTAWADGVALTFGMDDGTPAYAAQIEACARQAAENLAGHALSTTVLNQLSERVESQLALAQVIEKMAVSGSRFTESPLTKADLWVPLSKTLQFLADDCTPQNIDLYANLKRWGPAPSAKSISDFHDFYWSLTQTQRIDFFTTLLSPVFEKSRIARGLHAALRPIIEAFLPARAPQSQAHEYGWSFGRALSRSASNAQAVHMMVCLLTAVRNDIANPKSADPAVRFGYRLNEFLVLLGGVKIAQGAHNFSNTPQPWREGLSHSKSRAAPMPRAGYLRKVHAQNITGLARIGRALGTGTYIDTKEVFFTPEFLEKHPAMKAQQEKTGLAIQILKDDAAPQSREVFSLAIDTMRDLIEQDEDARRSIGGLISVIEHKAEMIAQETDLNCVALKARIAENLLKGVSIRQGSLSALFSTSGVFMHGAEYRIAGNIAGLHFNQLPESTPQEKKIKNAAAEFIFTAEMMTMLSGKPFNHDQHGDNQGVVVDGQVLHIGNFDDGAIIIDPPLDAQKRMFANILMDALANTAVNGFSPLSSLKHTFARAQADPALADPARKADLHYVDAMIEAVGSLGDYMKYMNTTAYLRAMRAIYDANTTDPVIAQSFAQRFTTIANLTRGRTDLAESRRHRLYYPAPDAESKKFTSGINRKLGAAILKGAGLLMGSKLAALAIGHSRIELPRGYHRRSMPR